MFDKTYKDHIATLKEREARPSFEKMSALLATHDAKAATIFGSALGRVWLIVGGVALMMAVLLPVSQRDEARHQPLKTSGSASELAMQGATAATQESHDPVGGAGAAHHAMEVRMSAASVARASKINYASANASSLTDNIVASADIVEPSTIAPPSSGDSAQEITPLNARSIPISKISVVGNAAALVMPIHAAHESAWGRLFLGIGGSLAQETGPNAGFRMLSAKNIFLSGDYVFSSRFAIGIVGGQEKFIVSRTKNTTIFQPTTVVQNGVTYTDLIGHIVPTPTPVTTELSSIAGSLRYMIEDDPTSPYVEVLGGGSSEGALAETAVGMSLVQFGNLSLDGDVFVRTLIPPSGATLTKFGLSAAVRFEW